VSASGAALRPGVTAVILTHNEALHIARAVASARQVCSDVIVVDSGSTDGTAELAREAGARVLHNPWVNYARQFAWALEHGGIGTAWVLRLDADELIGGDLAARIAATLPTLGADVAGVTFDRRHIFMGRWIRHGGRYPLRLLRLWRTGHGEVEDRWMDEHVLVTGGRTVHIDGAFEDASLRDIAFFVAKHNGYAAREAIDVLDQRLGLFGQVGAMTAHNSGRQAGLKRLVKQRFYNRMPFGTGPALYFLYRYFLQLGFLDGRPGLVYHFLQGFWYRFLVDVRLWELERAVAGVSSREDRIAALARATGLKL